jgi:hypothetical protein
MNQHPVYPALFKGGLTEFIDKPCTLSTGEKVWQQCYVCGISITFNKDVGKWQNIGNGLIRHKDCEPLPYRKGMRSI